MMNILLPCGGTYKRFPPGMPKYIRPLNDMRPMFVWALKSIMNYPDAIRVFFAVRKEDEENSGVSDIIKAYVRDVQVMVLKSETQGPAHTVYEIIKHFNITGKFIIKDCDCHLRPISKWPEGNAIYMAWRETAVGDRGSKSWVQIDENKIIKAIEEKKTPTDWYCHGAYQFTDPNLFCSLFNDLRHTTTKEIFCSHIIQTMIDKNLATFEGIECTDVYDWGTWEKYIEWRRSKKVYFIDVDGCVVNAGAPYGKKRLWGDIVPLNGVKEKIINLKEKGCHIILTTSRPLTKAEETEKILKDNGILFDRIIYDIPNGPRILVNDYDTSNPYPSAEAINTKRDSGDWLEKI